MAHEAGARSRGKPNSPEQSRLGKLGPYRLARGEGDTTQKLGLWTALDLWSSLCEHAKQRLTQDGRWAFTSFHGFHLPTIYPSSILIRGSGPTRGIGR